MRIGIDGRNLINDITGIGRYVMEMTLALAATDTEIDLIVYLPEAPPYEILKRDNIQLRIDNFRGAAARAVWGNTVLPLRANLDRLNVFWGPAHRLPFGLASDVHKVITIHDLVWLIAPSTMHWKTFVGERLFMKRSLSRADQILTVSNSTKDDLTRLIPRIKKDVRTVYPGISVLDNCVEGSSIGELKRKLGITGENFFLFVGTIEPRKNILNVLKAYSLLRKDICERVPMVIVGKWGWKSSPVAEEVERLRVDRKIILAGYLNDASLALLYKSASCLVMPSIYEGFGLPIIEANQHGTPVITSNSSSMPEAVGAGGIQVNPTDIKSIALAMESIITDSKLACDLKAGALANASRFSWVHSAKDFLEIVNFRKNQGAL